MTREGKQDMERGTDDVRTWGRGREGAQAN